MEKIVLITGASKGIGRHLAEVFAKNGFSLILIARTTSELKTLQKELQNKYQCESQIGTVDLSHPDAVDEIINLFKDELPNIEILINNAGFGLAKKFSDMPEKEVDGMLAVNIRVLTKLTYHLLPIMVKKKRGKILNVASTAAYAPGPYMSLYYASKAFVLSFSESLYEEYKDDGILISTLCPGVTPTSFQARAKMEHINLVKFLPNMTAQEVSNIAYDGLMRNKRVIITGFMNKLFVLLMRLTPNFISAKMTAQLQRPTNRR